jgi:hypothetical protein
MRSVLFWWLCQIIKELHLNLFDDEMKDFYRLLNKFPDCVEVGWERVPPERVVFYQDRGCRKGDAIIAAHAEILNADLIVSNNRQFLQTVANLSAEIVTPAQALSRLPSVNAE